MKVLGKYLLNNTYHVIEVKRAAVAFGWSDHHKENYVIAYSDFAEYNICSQDQTYLTLEEANQLVKQIARNDLIDLDEYQMAFYEIQDVGVPIRNQYDSGAEEVIPLIITKRK